MARILIVDDDPDIVEVSRIVLEKEGHEITSAGSREEAMELVASFDPDLILLDVMMREPDDGIFMAQELRDQGFTKPIMMLTSLSQVTGYDYGTQESVVPVEEFQEKPIDPATLVRRVAALLKR